MGVKDRREAILSGELEGFANLLRQYHDQSHAAAVHWGHQRPHPPGIRAQASTGQGFTSKYFLERLVYLEETNDVSAAIAREKELKGWRRSKKIALIEKVNPHWSDLSRDLIG